MVYKCKNCGAKLQVEKNAETVTCEYCGSVNKVEFSMTDYFRNISVKSKKYTKISVFFTIGIIVFGIVSSVIFKNKGVSSFTDGDSYYGVHKYNYYQDSGYLIDNNNDDYLDIVTIALNIENSQSYLQILDGRTGEKIKSIQIDKEKEPKLFVVNEKYICVPKGDFTISIYDKTELSEIKSFSLSDKVDMYTFSDNKLFFETHDDNLWTIDFNTIELKKESFDVKLENRPSRYIHVNTVDDGNNTYTAKKKEKSSKDVFSIIAENENETLWNLPLGFEDMTWWDGPVIVLADQNIVTFGKKFTSDNLGYLIGIDKTEGRIKYEVQKSGKSCKLYDFYYNGRYVIANINGSYHAFDPSTGETKWLVGNVCE